MAIASQIPLQCRLPDASVERLALQIGSWSQPALLESGPGFGEAGPLEFLYSSAEAGVRGQRRLLDIANRR